MRKTFYIVLLFVYGLAGTSWGQGCSDPGLCTIGTLHSDATKDSVSDVDFVTSGIDDLLSVPYTSEKVRVQVSAVYGQGEKSTNLYSLTSELFFRLKNKMQFSVKVPYTIVSGRLGQNNGVGDITLGWQNTIYSGKGKRLALTMGLVLPPNDANASLDGFVLPMAYQTSLGMSSALIGFSGAVGKWSGMVGYQIAFGTNSNQFYSPDLVTNPADENYDPLNVFRRRFASSRFLERGSDLAIRLERRIRLSRRLSGTVGVLPIFRLGESEIELPSGERVSLEGTDGITFNMTGGVRYALNRDWNFVASVGGPVGLQRDVRADGLTRMFVGILSVQRKFW